MGEKGKKAERIRKENKNLSGDGEGEGGGESRVQNSPKAFGELKITMKKNYPNYSFIVYILIHQFDSYALCIAMFKWAPITR